MARREVAIPKRRIGMGTKLGMVTLALVLDFAVLILLIMGIVLAFSTGVIVKNVASTAAEQHAMKSNCTVSSLLDLSGAIEIGIDAAGKALTGKSFCSGMASVSGKISGAVAGAAAGLFVGGALFFVFPAIAILVSIVTSLLSVMIFSVWFYAKGVNVWGLKGARIALNLLAVVLESIPFLNAIAPMQTIAVIGHIYVSQKEDDKLIREAKKDELPPGMMAA